MSNNNEIASNSSETASVSSDSSLSSSDNVRECRICNSSRHQDNIIDSPCYCKGTMGAIHFKCLDAWLKTKQQRRPRCEICNYEYEAERIPRYGFLESFWIFKSQPIHARSVRFLLMRMFIWTIIFAIYSGICVLQYVNYSWNPLQTFMSDNFTNNFAAGVAVYLCAIYVYTIDFYRMWSIWWKSTHIVRFINVNSENNVQG